jgi:hypothetical protein
MLITTVLAALALTVTQVVVGAIVPIDVAPAANMLPWMLVANLLLSATLAGFAREAILRGTRLALVLFGVAFVIGHLTSLIEAVVFGVLPSATVWRLVPVAALPLLAACAVVAWRSGAPGATPVARGYWRLPILRALVCVVLYVVCYFVAGTIIFPYVKDFYATRYLPPGPVVAALQLLVRGPLFVAAVGVLVRLVPGTRPTHALVGLAAMVIIGGIVPLIVPNPFFPDAVRWVHFAEVVGSHVVFGGATGWLLSSDGRH